MNDHEDPDVAWRNKAACIDQPTNRFVEPGSDADVRHALRVCCRCPVAEPCLREALITPPVADVGIWGGTTPLTRRRMRDGRLPPQPRHDAPKPLPERPRLSVAADDGPSANEVSRLAEPEITLGRKRPGEYADMTGRVVARRRDDGQFELSIDGRRLAVSRTLTEARRLAWRHLEAKTGPDHRARVSRRRTSRDLMSQAGLLVGDSLSNTRTGRRA